MAIVQTKIWPIKARPSTRSALIDFQAIRMVATSPPSVRAGVTGGISEGREQAHGREHREEERGQEEMAANTVENEAAADEPGQHRQVRDRLEQPVSFREIFVRQELGQDPVFRGHEQSGLDADQEKDRHRRPAAGWVKIEGGRPREHQRQLEYLHRDDDRSLAHAVGQHAGRQREERQRKHERDLGERRHPVLAASSTTAAIARIVTTCLSAWSLNWPKAWATRRPCSFRQMLP